MAPESPVQPLLRDEDRAPELGSWSSGSESQRGTLTESKDGDAKTWLAEELSQQFQIAGPMILVNLLQYLLTLVPIMFVGHLGELALSSSAIAGTFAGATGSSIMMGMASALETFCGQAYGAKEYRLMGIFLQRAVVVLSLVCIPISILWWNMAPFLKLIGQDPVISDAAQEYIRLLIPTLFAYAFIQPMVKFLQTQSAVKAMAVFVAITLVVHIPMSYLLIQQLGFRGAAIATGISQWLNGFSSTFKETWTGFSTEAMEDIYPFLKIAVPSTIMMCLEYWCFDAVVLVAGLLPNPQLEASSLAICLYTIAILYMVPLGFSAAVSTRVSNKLGAGLPFEAKAAVKMTVTLALIEGCTVCILLISVRNVFPYLFSSDVDVVEYVSSMVPFLAIATVADSIQATLSGVARGCGWQELAAYSNLLAYYIIAIPTALLMTFHFNLHGYGLWIGINCGLVTQAFLLACITLKLNWQKLADDASELVGEARDHHKRLLSAGNDS
ncbi:hypothetical protein R1sor_015999 [Riccia sorocarpa]|uniref:Protein DETOXIFICATION n=1 Tax=Riccia sorocarpa TaxID=122646 RepID=A0ABD3HHU5_9MARC